MFFPILSWLSSLHSWELLWWVSWGCEGTRGLWVRPSLRGKQVHTHSRGLHSLMSSQCIISCQVRALIEGQFLSKRAHTERFGMPSPPIRIIATGGASANENILSLISAIFGCDVYTVQRPGNTFNITNKLGITCLRVEQSVCFHRLSITWSCTESCSWLALQQKRKLCTHFIPLQREIREDISELQA